MKSSLVEWNVKEAKIVMCEVRPSINVVPVEWGWLTSEDRDGKILKVLISFPIRPTLPMYSVSPLNERDL